jgi:hypothetical protein
MMLLIRLDMDANGERSYKVQKTVMYLFKQWKTDTQTLYTNNKQKQDKNKQ